MIAVTAASATQADQDENDVLQPGQFPPLNTRVYRPGYGLKSTGAAALGLLLLAFLGTFPVALGLSLGGLMQRERKKVFVILGTVFSAFVLVLTAIDIKHRPSTLAVRFKHKIIPD